MAYDLRADIRPDTVNVVALQRYLKVVIERLNKQKLNPKRRGSSTGSQVGVSVAGVKKVPAAESLLPFIDIVQGRIEVPRTKFICEADGKEAFSFLESEQDGLESIEVSTKLGADGRSIEVWSPSVAKIKTTKLFTVSVDPSAMPLLKAEAKFFKPKYRNKPSLRCVRPHLTDLRISPGDQGTDTADIQFRIEYSISVKQALNEHYSLDFIRSLRELSEFVLTPHLTAYEKAGAVTEEDERALMAKPTQASFYSLITDHTEKTAFDKERGPMVIPGIRKQLMGFQSQTLEWMLGHEGQALGISATAGNSNDDKPVFVAEDKLLAVPQTDDEIARRLDDVCFGWSKVHLCGNAGDTTDYWYNTYTGNLCSSEFALASLAETCKPFPAQALLSEEMGLGKTVEVISLIRMHPRPAFTPFDEKKLDLFSGERFLSECKTTLIICPQTIIGQWLSEIKEASELNVMVYEGITEYEKEAKEDKLSMRPEDVARRLSAYDIVLVSYHTVSRELHRAVFRPTTRPKRHCAKRLKMATPGVTFDYSGKMITESGGSSVEESEDEEYERIDYSSPLMLLEFWRVVLDEVQMTASINTNAAKFARIIPRVHAWGVSGTLIKNGLDDLRSLLSFLRFNPIDRFSMRAADAPWNMITEVSPFYQFNRLFTNITLRHTKKMVADQIQLPMQTRIMLRTPFTTVERDNYDVLFSEFLTQVGLDEDGRPTTDDYDPTNYMRQWLIKLRQACSHAQLGRPMYAKHGTVGENDGMIVGTLGEVLEDLIKNTFDDYSSNDRAYYSERLRKGKVYEFLGQPDESAKLFAGLIPELELKIKELRDNNDDKNTNGPKIRSWLELLHQTYFLLASAHYQHYRPMREIPDNFKDLVALDVNEEEQKLPIDRELLTDEEKKHYDIENEYYNKADSLLMQILDEPLAKVDESIAEMTKHFKRESEYKLGTFKMPPEERKKLEEEKLEFVSPLKAVCDIIDVNPDLFGNNLGFNSQTSIFFERVKRTLAQLNMQAHLINEWSTKLLKLLQEPVTRDQKVDQLTGEEYGDTLINQESANTYIEELEAILEDREHAIIPVEQMPSFRRKNASTRTRHKEAFQLDENHSTNRELHMQMDKIRRELLPDGCFNSRYSLKLLWLEAAGIADDMKVVHEGDSDQLVELMEATSDELKQIFNEQKKNINALRTKSFESMNGTFNAKVAYFRALQVKSDALQNYRPEKPHKTAAGELTPKEAALVELRGMDSRLEEMRSKMATNKVRLTYLKSLIPRKGINADDSSSVQKIEPEKFCVICRSKIIVGSLTACGHQFCKECLHEWTKNKPTCPVCKRVLHPSDLYTFRQTKVELKGGLVDTSEESKETLENDGADEESAVELANEKGKLNNARQVEKDLFKIYKLLDDDMLREIMSIPLKQSYGSKIDMIVRQAIFLRSHEKGVQILVFSQWPQFLGILGHALRFNGVEFLSSDGNSKRRQRSSGHAVSKVVRSLRGSREIEEFKQNPDITCFLLNAKAQAAGLTLTNASHVFLCEPLVNLPLELQAISRIHRIGQTKPTTVWNFVIENSVEESIAYMSTKKRLELSRAKADHRGDDNYKDDESDVDEDAIGVTELSKNLDNLVDKNDGEVIADDDLWSSFFAAKSAKVAEALAGMHTTESES